MEENLSSAGVAYSAQNTLLKFHYSLSRLRLASNKELVNEVEKLVKEVPKNILYSYIFYLRDIRGGMGERRIFRECIRQLAEKDTSNMRGLIHYVAEYGRYDDLFVLVHTKLQEEVTCYLYDTLMEDIRKMNVGQEVTLLAKWLPSENASNRETKQLAKYFAEKFRLSPKLYRKCLSTLRGYSKVAEHLISKSEFSKVEYASVPSGADKKYSRLFMKKDKERREGFLEEVKKGNTPVSSAEMFPSEVVAECRLNSDKKFVQALWDNVKDFGETEDTLVVANVSGYMDTFISPKERAKDVSIGLGMYFAERCKNAFSNKVISYSDKPKVIKLKEHDFQTNFRKIAHSDAEDILNLDSVYKLVLKRALREGIEELPTILVITDKPFSEVRYCGADRQYESKGYKIPKLVYWNILSSENKIPIVNGNIIEVSGYSPVSIMAVMSGEYNAFEALLSLLNVPRYNIIRKHVN